MSFKPLGLDHVVLHVRDQQVSMAFYTDVLGCTLDHINEALSLIHLRFGAHMIDLVPGAGAAEGGVGVDHICLSIACEDLDAVRRALEAHSVKLDGGIVMRRGAYGTGPALYLRDPDGYSIELKPRPQA